jgi:hypothetical protein
MTKKESKQKSQQIKALLKEDEDFLRPLMRVALQEVLEAEMTEALGAGKAERSPERLGYRSGYYNRKLLTRVGTLELRVPQDRQGDWPALPRSLDASPASRAQSPPIPPDLSLLPPRALSHSAHPALHRDIPLEKARPVGRSSCSYSKGADCAECAWW